MTAAPPTRARKRLIQRAEADRSQILRHTVQALFLALNVWIGIEFWLFVRYYETGGRTVFVRRPPGVEGWLPIASLMNLKVLLLTGRMPVLHPAGMFLLIAFLAMSLIFRKSFCGWLCPVGTISEQLWRLGRQTFGRNFHVPRRVDVALRSLKYLLMGLFLYAVGSMSVTAIRTFLEGPYGIVDDVKMLNFFRYLGLGGGAVVAVLVVASVFVQNFWCRYLCPYGALMGLAGLASPLRIRREADLCIDCAKCAKACPSALPVDQLIQIRSAECTGCLQCVAECPAGGALYLAAPTRRLRICTVDRLLAYRPSQQPLSRADSARRRVYAPIAKIKRGVTGARLRGNRPLHGSHPYHRGSHPYHRENHPYRHGTRQSHRGNHRSRRGTHDRPRPTIRGHPTNHRRRTGMNKHRGKRSRSCNSKPGGRMDNYTDRAGNKLVQPPALDGKVRSEPQ